MTLVALTIGNGNFTREVGWLFQGSAGRARMHAMVESRHGVGIDTSSLKERAGSRIFQKSIANTPTARDDLSHKDSDYQREQDEMHVRASRESQEGKDGVLTHYSN